MAKTKLKFKHTVLAFFGGVALLTTAAVMFIQSAYFADILKRVLFHRIPINWGVKGDFSDIAIQIFPPALSIQNPKVNLEPNNIVDLPAGSTIAAKRIDLIFRPFQIFFGNIQVNRVVIGDGDVQLAFPKGYNFATPAPPKKQQPKAKGGFIQWDDLFKIRAESVALENTHLRVSFENPKVQAELTATILEIGQWNSRAGKGYQMELELKNIQGSFPKAWGLPSKIDGLSSHAYVNSSGLNLESFKFVVQENTLEFTGRIDGDLLNPKNLKANGNFAAKGDLFEILKILHQEKGKSFLPSGNIQASGKFRSDLDRPWETLEIEGKLDAKSVSYQEWFFDSLKLEGGWDNSKAIVQGAEIESAPRDRVPPFTPGWGGKVKIGAFSFNPANLDKDEQLKIPLEFERAHIHWLAAPAQKDIFNLIFRISGTADLAVTPKGKDGNWTIDAVTKLDLENFQLDNQRFSKSRALRHLLKIPSVKLNGSLAVNANGLQPKELKLGVGTTDLAVTGQFGFKTGFGLKASGNIDLKDFNTLSEVPIRGQGPFVFSIHGPGSNLLLDFDCDLKDTSYLRLGLGSLKGMLTYDDGADRLIFRDVNVTRDQTQFSVGGNIQLGNQDSIDLTATIRKGYIQEFASVFKELYKHISWFPHKLNGPFTGSVKVSGGLTLSQLEVFGDFKGTNWEYLGEKFKTMAIKGGYDKGTYYLQSLNTVKNSGRILGQVSYVENTENLTWDLRTEGLSLTDVDMIAKMEVPVRGRLNLQSNGSGRVGQITSVTQGSISDVSVRGQSLPSSNGSLKSAGGIATFKGNLLGNQGSFEGQYDFHPKGNSFVKGEYKHLDFSPILLVLNPKLVQDTSLAGFISGSVDLKFQSNEVEKATGRIDLNEYLLSKTGTKFNLVDPVSVKIDRGTFHIPSAQLRGHRGDTQLSLRGNSGNLSGALKGRLDLSFTEFVLPQIAQAGGAANLDFVIGGSIKEPSLSGRANLEDVTLRIPSIDSTFENMSGTVQLKQNVLQFQNIEASLGNGRIHAAGKVSLFVDRYPDILLTGSIGGSRLKIYPFQVVRVQGGLRIVGDEPPYQIEGAVTIDSGLIREKVMGGSQSRSLRTTRYTPPPPTTKSEGDTPLFKLNVKVLANQGISIKNDLFNSEMKGQITVVNTIDTPRLLGNASTIQGKMTFKDREFLIQSFNLEFDNPTVINPLFNLSANTSINNTKIQLFASGRIDKYKIELTSNPAMQESEILNLLALGLTADEMNKIKSSDRSALQQSEAASILLNSMDFNRDIHDKTGFQVQLDESVDSQAGASVSRPRTESETTTSSPKIVLKRQVIKDRLDVSVGSTVGVGTNTEKEVSAELKLPLGFSIQGVYDIIEGNGVDTNNRTSYGADLKLQKRFK